MRVTLLVLCLATAGIARADRIAENASCAGCHPDIAAEWTRSLHKQAWTDPVFAKAYAIEPVAFCRGCHAPEAEPAREPEARAQAVGIGCTTCHGDTSGVHAAHASPAALHAITVDTALATTQACARCHEFDFPAAAHQRRPQPMQDTVAEHARSERAATPCQGCHMPLVDGVEGKHRSHSFAVLADPAMIRRAATVTAERRDDVRATTVRVSIRGADIGHAFPTGDMFRRLEVRAERTGPQAAARPVVLGRRFEDRPRDPHGRDLTFMRVEADDTRVPPPGLGERVAELVLPPGPDAVRWTVVYQRMSTPMATAFGVSQVLDEVVVATGTLPALTLARTGGPK